MATAFRPRIRPDEAIELARQEYERRHIVWREPVRVRRLFDVYHVRPDAAITHGGRYVVVDALDGSILAVRGPLPR